MVAKSSELAKQIQQEHEELRRELDSIKKEIAREVSSEQFIKWRLEFLWKLRDFKNEMLKHFDLEELSGFTDDLLNLAPHYMNRFVEIKAEHQKIIADLDVVLQDLRSIDDMSGFGPIRQKLNDLLTFIEAHEAAERELLEDTYLQDYGAND